MTNQFFSNPAALARLLAGPLGPHMDLFASLLSEKGYTRRTIRRQLRAIAGLSRWLEERGLRVDDLDEESLSRFEEQAPKSSDAFRRLRAAYPILLEALREIGVIEKPAPSPPGSALDSALDCALDDFSQYLLEQRGLVQTTITGYRRVIRDFLEKRFGSGPILPEELSPADVQQFILRRAQAGSARQVASALRNFLRSLRLTGEIDTNLAAAVPMLATRPAKLPESLKPEQARQLLASCDLGSVEGLRDHAILLLLARLGLRAGEVVAMRLCDLDWRSGELTVRGKGMCWDRLPILQDVGEALVAYLRQGRPECSSPQVFLRLQAPYRGLAQATSVGSIVRRALHRAGLDPRHKGAHLLRHTLATEMLRQGASLREIAQILRHRNTQTTEIYARVDLDALRDLAQPWPGACP
jgi:site-specific recombinase XerD